MAHLFVEMPEDYSKVYLYERELNSKGKLVTVRQVLWGDFLHIDDDPTLQPDPEWTMVVWAPETDKLKLKIRTRHVTEERPLEIIFVDVGQGDGSILITPERNERERIIVIDAGQEEHMLDFLDQRFSAYRKGFLFHAAVITHPDQDHYLGFLPIFASEKIRFRNIYHSGLLEQPKRSGWEQLGGLTKDTATGIEYLQSLAVDHAAAEALFGAGVDVPTGPKEKKFPQLMRAALDNGTFANADGTPGEVNIQMLSSEHGDRSSDGRTWMPDFSPDDDRGYQIEVIGPVVEQDTNGTPGLRRLANYGKTKNGHSVLLKLCYNDFTVLFGGDLNSVAEKFLLKHHANIARWPRKDPARQAMIDAAAKVFRADVMKVCHHGAADVTDEFLETVNPAAFIISSGDQEGHVHPRPDLLGRLGKLGRGASPVLLSTELQRSTREKEDAKLVARLKADVAKQAAKPTAARGERIGKDIDVLGRTNVTVDGAIYVKTDGTRLIAAFKIETGSDKKKWFYFGYELDGDELKLVES